MIVSTVVYTYQCDDCGAPLTKAEQARHSADLALARALDEGRASVGEGPSPDIATRPHRCRRCAEVRAL